MRAKSFSTFALLCFLAGVFLPNASLAKDATGNKCTCTFDDYGGGDDVLLRSDISEELGTDYPTPTTESCKTACLRAFPGPDLYKSHTFVAATAKEEATAKKKAADLITPELGVPIPGVTLSSPFNADGNIVSKFLPEYIAGVYRYALGAAAFFAIVMIMIGGAQYIIGAATGGEAVTAAKARITNAVTGLVLVLAAYTILYVVNPGLTAFSTLSLQNIPENPFTIRYADETEQKTACKDRQKMTYESTERVAAASNSTLKVPAASSCPNTKVPQTIRDQAYTTQQSTGVPAAVLLAQWAIESGYGAHCIGAHGNNCWGIKCTSGGTYAGMDTLVSSGTKPTCPASCSSYKTKEVKGGVTDDYYACFQDYATMSEAMTKHSAVVQKSGWQSYNGSATGFAKFVNNNCYATAPSYGSALLTTMKSQCLY